MSMWNAPSDYDYEQPEYWDEPALCNQCRTRNGYFDTEGLCGPCWDEYTRELAAWYESLDTAPLEPTTAPSDARTDHERRCPGCLTFFAPREDEKHYCDRCIALYREWSGWCNTCQAPKWTHTDCEGCK